MRATPQSLTHPLLMPGIRLDRDVQGETERARRRALEPWVMGFCIFGGRAEEVATLTAQLERIAERPLRFASDMERGGGQQVEGLSWHPPLGLLGVHAREREIEAIGERTAREARSVGIDVLFAPVLDVRSEPRNPIVGARSFGTDPARVATQGAAYVRGALAGGAFPVGKHFPGHGATVEDSHDACPVVTAPRDVLLRRELPPFRAALDAGCPALMTAHVCYPGWDGDAAIATFHQRLIQASRALVPEQGPIAVFTDALLMAGALGPNIDEREAARRSLEAGADVLLYPESPERVAATFYEVDAPRRDALETHAAQAHARWQAAIGERLPLRDVPAASTLTELSITCARRAVAAAGIGPQRSGRIWILDDDNDPRQGRELARRLEAGARSVSLIHDASNLPAPSEGPSADDVVVVLARVRAWKGAAGVSETLASWLADTQRTPPVARVIACAPMPVGGREHVLGTGPGRRARGRRGTARARHVGWGSLIGASSRRMASWWCSLLAMRNASSAMPMSTSLRVRACRVADRGESLGNQLLLGVHAELAEHGLSRRLSGAHLVGRRAGRGPLDRRALRAGVPALARDHGLRAPRNTPWVGARTLASAIFHVMTLVRAGLMLLLVAKALQVFTGWDLSLSILLVGMGAMAYSAIGGLGAVVWTDAIQLVLIVIGLGGAAWVILSGVPGGIDAVAQAERARTHATVDLSLSLDKPFSLFASCFGYVVLLLFIGGTNQQMVQRYMACKSTREARRAVGAAWAVGTVVAVLAVALGAALALRVGPDYAGTDRELVTFLAREAPTGLVGVLAAAILAAAMSSVDSAVHALSTATLVDGVERMRGAPLQGLRRLMWAKRLTLGYGVLATGLALLFAVSAADETILKTLIRWLMFFAGPGLGLFVLALLPRRPRQAAVLAGVVVGLWPRDCHMEALAAGADHALLRGLGGVRDLARGVRSGGHSGRVVAVSPVGHRPFGPRGARLPARPP